MRIIGITTLDGKGRIVLTEEVRKELNVKKGEKVVIIKKGKTIRLHTMDKLR